MAPVPFFPLDARGKMLVAQWEPKLMQFIEITGKVLQRIVSDDELHPDELAALGVTDESVVRVNRQGDIELRRTDRWDVIGGLLGEFEDRIGRETGMQWV
jgi:hypothetical protein